VDIDPAYGQPRRLAAGDTRPRAAHLGVAPPYCNLPDAAARGRSHATRRARDCRPRP
jgi:hypothetical protein